MEEDEGGGDEVEAEDEVAVVVATGTITEIMKEVVPHRDKTIVGRILLRHLRKMSLTKRRTNFI